ncbi:MAG: glycosyltransferase family 4 protein [bacterium]
MSGSDRRALEYSRYFIGAGHSITLVLPQVGVERYKDTGARLLISDSNPNPSKPTLGLFLKRINGANKVTRNLDLSPDDVIYSSSDLLADSIPAINLKKKHKDAKLICGLHLISPHPLKGFKNVFTSGLSLPGLRDLYYYFSQRYVISQLKKYASLVLVSNEMDKAKLITSGFTEERVLVAYGAADKDTIARASSSQKEYDAVFIGRLHRQKGLDDLMSFVNNISQKKKDFSLALISDIPAYSLQPILDKYGIQRNVFFFGFKDNLEKFEIMKKSRFLVFPSFYESFGMVICEAMACGLAVLAYDLPIYKDIYPAGILKARIGDVDDLVEKALVLLTDDSKLKALSEEAFEVSKKFDWEKTAKAILSKLG